MKIKITVCLVALVVLCLADIVKVGFIEGPGALKGPDAGIEICEYFSIQIPPLDISVRMFRSSCRISCSQNCLLSAPESVK